MIVGAVIICGILGALACFWATYERDGVWILRDQNGTIRKICWAKTFDEAWKQMVPFPTDRHAGWTVKKKVREE